MRLDRALTADLGRAFHATPILVFLGLEAAAGLVFVWRRGPDTLGTVLLIWVGMLAVAFLAWWAGRHRLAHPHPDPVTGAGARSLFALVGVAGMFISGFEVSRAAGVVLFVGGLVGWLWTAWRTSGPGDVWPRLTRDVRPFIPLLLLIGLPRLVVGGPTFVIGTVLALPSGIGQQLLYLVGLYAPLEAFLGRPALAAVAAALLFGMVHVPPLVGPNHGDWLAALANAVLFQASVGLIAVLAYQRHRAVVPIGVAHALAIG